MCGVCGMRSGRGLVVAEQTTQAGAFQVGPVDGNCLEAWQAFGPAEVVEDAQIRATGISLRRRCRTM